MNLVVTALTDPGVLIVRASLTVHVLHRIAEAFTSEYTKMYALHELLRLQFSERTYRWYSLDMSVEGFCRIMFSNAANPRTLDYQGLPVSIVSADREPFELRVRTSDLVKPGRLTTNTPHPNFINLLNSEPT